MQSSLTPQLIDDVCDRYERERDRYAKLTRAVHEICVRHFIEDSGLLVNVTARTKSVASLRRKLERIAERGEKPEWRTVDDVFQRLSDISGVRIAYYSGTDAELIRAGLQRVLDASDFDVKDKFRRGQPHLCYRATHCQVTLPEATLSAENSNLRGLACEIQICSMMQHVWNEIEHDIGYKPRGETSEAERAKLAELGELTRNGDAVIEQLLLRFKDRVALDDRIDDETGLTEQIQNIFDIRRITFRDNVGALFALLGQLEVTTRAKLLEAMGLQKHGRAGRDEMQRLWEEARTEIRPFNNFLTKSGDERYCLEARKSADPALMLILMNQHEAILAQQPAGRGRGRPTKIRSLAKRYGEYLARRRSKRAPRS